MYHEQFIERLIQLRLTKGVSARDMSLSLGQNSGYINNIESGKALPSMTVFFYMCDYFNISPKDFFEFDIANPQLTNKLFQNIKKLDNAQNDYLLLLTNDLIELNRKKQT